TNPDEDYPYSTIAGLREIVADAAGSSAAIRRVGLGGKGLMGAELWASLQAALPAAEWVDVERELCDLRAQKSPAELAFIRTAYRIAERGLAAAIDAIRVGISEREVAAEADAAMRRAGAEGT